MTVLAGHVRMTAYQRKRCPVMIEIGILPIGWIMTGRAIGAIISVVCIILLVAGIAIRGRALENLVDMAGVTGSFPVPAFKLEGRQVVIERCGSPAIHGVAIAT